MVDVLTENILKNPVDIITDFARNSDTSPKWYAIIKSADWKTRKPLTLGSKFAFVALFYERKLAYANEFIELVPD